MTSKDKRKKEGESVGSIGFCIAINRDKQRRNTVLSFPDNEEFREVKRLEMLIRHFLNIV